MKLFYRHFGEGYPLIILHGIFGISDNWVSIAKELSANFSVYVPDQRNHGQSPHSDYFSYPALVEDLKEFIDEHELKTPILIGHSMGGKVAMNFSLEYPDQVENLVVVDISPRSYPGRQVHQQMLEAMLSIDFDRMTNRGDVDKYLEGSIESFRIRQFVLKNLHRVGRDRLAWRLNVKALYNNLTNVFEGIATGPKYPGPTLFIRGGNSDYITHADLPLISALFPAGEVRTIDGASHWVHADAPEELLKLIGEQLTSEIRNTKYEI
jgi:esterase